MASNYLPQGFWCTWYTYTVMRAVDYTGTRFGYLVCQKRTKRNGFTYYICLCDCGNEKEVRQSNLVGGRTKSCGCFHRKSASERIKARFTGHPTMNAVGKYYRRNAKMRKVDWNLTKEQFEMLILQPCHYCGHEGKKSTTGSLITYNGLDRVDNNLGYIVGNVAPCCMTCNSAKGALTLEEFRVWVKRIHTRVEKW